LYKCVLDLYGNLLLQYCCSFWIISFAAAFC